MISYSPLPTTTSTARLTPVCTPLRYQRLLRGWSQQDVADHLYARCVAEGNPDVGIHAKLVGRWERGENIPRPIYRKHLCQLYGLTAAQLGLLKGLEVHP
jgi:transcriptional regulator with XRE-family HTH domain